jgi:hypothetical protein
MEAQVRQLDAFLAGDVTEDGDATHWSADSKRPERLQQYKDLCNQLVPNLTAAIKKQSQMNLNVQPKSRVHGDKNPEHRSFWKLFLAPNLVTMYGEWVEKSRKKGINPDVDHWTNSLKFGKLIKLFQSIYELQYDFKDWKHMPPKPIFNQTPRLNAEEFMRVMDNCDQIRVYYHVVTPLGKGFSQLDIIPETAVNFTEKELTSMWRDKTRPKYLVPDPTTVTIPPKRRNTPWMNEDGVGKIWTRGELSWSPSFKFMVFDKATDAYIHEHLVDLDLLDQIGLNNEYWVLKYRKKISQWRGRATREATKVRDHWTNEERAVVYEFANTWLKKNGVDKFMPRILDGEKDDLQAGLVKRTGHMRSAESVSAWARQQMTAKPNEPLGMLYAKGQKMATRIDAGEDVADHERYPDEAIDVAEFLAKAKTKTPSRDGKSGKKCKHDPDEQSIADEDALNDPHNFDPDGDLDEDLDLDMQIHSDGSPPPHTFDKRPKLTAKAKGNQSARDVNERDFPPIKNKPLTKAEMDEHAAKHNEEAAAVKADLVADRDNEEIDLDFKLREADEEGQIEKND